MRANSFTEERLSSSMPFSTYPVMAESTFGADRFITVSENVESIAMI